MRKNVCTSNDYTYTPNVIPLAVDFVIVVESMLIEAHAFMKY